MLLDFWFLIAAPEGGPSREFSYTVTIVADDKTKMRFSRGRTCTLILKITSENCTLIKN